MCGWCTTCIVTVVVVVVVIVTVATDACYGTMPADDTAYALDHAVERETDRVELIELKFM